MTATALYTLIAAGAVLGGYALYRRSEGAHAARGNFPPGGDGHLVGWEHTTVDYQNPADAVTDQRYERNFFNRPYQIFCPGGEIRPYEVDAHGQPTGRQLVMPGESPTVGDPAEYVMVGFHPAHFGHHHHFGRGGLFALEQQQAALAEAEAEAEAEALAAQQDPLAMAAMGEFATGMTPAQMAMLRMRRMGMMGGGMGGLGRQSSFQQQLLMQQMQQMQQQIDALTAQQQLADTAALTATTGGYATGLNPYALAMRRRMLGGGGWYQRQLQQQLLQQQLLEAQLAQQQADLLAAQQQAAAAAAAATTAAVPLDPDAALGAAGV